MDGIKVGVFCWLMLLFSFLFLFCVDVYEKKTHDSPVEYVDCVIVEAESYMTGFYHDRIKYCVVVGVGNDFYTITDKTTYYLFKDKIGQTVPATIKHGLITTVSLIDTSSEVITNE